MGRVLGWRRGADIKRECDSGPWAVVGGGSAKWPCFCPQTAKFNTLWNLFVTTTTIIAIRYNSLCVQIYRCHKIITLHTTMSSFHVTIIVQYTMLWKAVKVGPFSMTHVLVVDLLGVRVNIILL